MSESEKAAVLIIAIPEQLSHLQTVLDTIKATYANVKKQRASPQVYSWVVTNPRRSNNLNGAGAGAMAEATTNRLVHKETKPDHVSDA